MELKYLTIEIYFCDKEEFDWISDLVSRRKIGTDILPIFPDAIRLGNRLMFVPKMVAPHLAGIDYMGRKEKNPDRTSCKIGVIEQDGERIELERESFDYGRLLYDYGAHEYFLSVGVKDRDKLFSLCLEKPLKAPDEVSQWYKTALLQRAEMIDWSSGKICIPIWMSWEGGRKKCRLSHTSPIS